MSDLRSVPTLATFVRDRMARRRAGELSRDDDVPQDLRAAVRDAMDGLSIRHGRCAVTRIAPRVFVLVGILGDDIEREWVTVRQMGRLVTTDRSSREEILATRKAAA